MTTLVDLFDLGLSLVQDTTVGAYWNPPEVEYTVACGLGCIMLGSARLTDPDASLRQLKITNSDLLAALHQIDDAANYADDVTMILNTNGHQEAANAIRRTVDHPELSTERSLAAAIMAMNDVLRVTPAEIRAFIAANTP